MYDVEKTRREMIKCPDLRTAIEAVERAQASGFETAHVLAVVEKRAADPASRTEPVEALYMDTLIASAAAERAA